MNKKYLVGLCVSLVCLLFSVHAMAATEVEKQAAIDAGLVYLIGTQAADGHFEAGGLDYDLSATGGGMLAFLEEGFTAGTDVVIGGTNYGDVVGKGINYLLGYATPYGISPQIAGNPDADGNTIGVKFYPGGNNGRDTYVTGLVLPAIASTGTPNALVTVGPLAGRTDGTGAGGAWTYKDVVQNAVDYFAYGQEDITAGNYRGGWRYFANSGSSDNSTAQWGPIGMQFASAMGVSAPTFVENELKHWIDYVQYLGGTPGTGNYGSSGYSSPTSYNNQAKTGGLLVEMVFAGSDLGGTAYNLSHPDLLAALGFLDRQWQQSPTGTWYGNMGHPYAMWSVYKGLQETIGLNDTTFITNLRAQASLRGGAGAPLDAGDNWTWWEDFCEFLVDSQFAGGNWTGYSYWGGPLAAAWNINILAATIVPGTGDVPIPEPATMLLLGTGLAGMGALRRRRKKT